jgi:hypothetical protein
MYYICSLHLTIWKNIFLNSKHVYSYILLELQPNINIPSFYLRRLLVTVNVVPRSMILATLIDGGAKFLRNVSSYKSQMA